MNDTRSESTNRQLLHVAALQVTYEGFVEPKSCQFLQLFFVTKRKKDNYDFSGNHEHLYRQYIFGFL